MSARLYRLGNIYTRIEGLIRKKHIKEYNKPLWFDVYKQFPPKYDPSFKRLEPDRTIKEILYEEDVLRARIHKEFRNEMRTFDLKEGMTEDEAIQKISSEVKPKVSLKTNDETLSNATVDIVDKSV